MQEKEEEKLVGDVSVDALEAVFAPDEALIEEEVFIVVASEEEEDDVDLAFQEDEGYW